MSNTTLTDATFAVGNPVTSANAIITNNAINDNDSRVTALETVNARVIVADFAVVGFVSQYNTQEIGSFITFEAPISFNLTTFSFTITDNQDNPSSSPLIPARTSDNGILELTLEKFNTTTLTWSSILTVNPVIEQGTSERGSSSNNATFANNAVQLGELIRIRPLSFKDSQGSFHIICTGEAV